MSKVNAYIEKLKSRRVKLSIVTFKKVLVNLFYDYDLLEANNDCVVRLSRSIDLLFRVMVEEGLTEGMELSINELKKKILDLNNKYKRQSIASSKKLYDLIAEGVIAEFFFFFPKK
jgi:hypothetical protein